jgi:DNA-binding beta-propeller fold protein YncE
VADTGNARVVVLERDLTSPRYLGKKAGAGPEELSSPIGIAVGPSGRVYVADSANKRVQVLDGSGAFRSRFAFPGWGPNTEPYLAVDASENLYATDPASQSVVALDRAGKETKRWAADEAGRRFSRPTGIALDAKKGLLYVVNTDTDTVSTLKLPS